jgi:molybdopterin converting factor small subunit
MGIDSWLDNGLKISINDVIVNEDEPVNDGDEIALLPPVSGG